MNEAGDAVRDRDAALLGRHYVAGNVGADDFSARLDILYGSAGDGGRATALAGLPALDAAAPAAVVSRRGWWRGRHGESDGPQPGWLPTPERFLDPTTDRVMRVWLDPATRRRHYLPDRAA